MQRLFKCHYYFMTLLVAVLFIVDTATSDNQTGVLTEETQQMTQKPTIMILGSTHLANNGLDYFNIKMDEVRIPKRQREIEQLVSQLKAYQPTKIALERDMIFDNGISRFGLEKVLELALYRKHPLTNFAKIFSLR